MAEINGYMNIMQRALPTGIDGTRIAEWQLRDGSSYGAMVQSLATALSAVNQQWVTRFGEVFSITEELIMEYPNGGSVTEMPEITDESKPGSVRGETIGHMLPLAPYGKGIGGTYRYFRDARQAQIQSSITTLVNQAKWRFEKKLFGRFFSSTENAIGSAGYDVPFVAGSGKTVLWVPPAYEGTAFTTSHSHFIGYDSGSKNMGDVLNGLAATLDEHGIAAPYTAWVSRADVASFRVLTKFIQFVAPVVTYIDRGSETTGNQMYANGQPMVAEGTFGYFQSDYGLIELKAFNRIPTGYVGLFKSYGQLAAGNPLAVRVHPAEGFGLKIRTETADDMKYPIKDVIVELEFGVGVGSNRANGAVGYLVSGGSYADATIG